MLNSKERAELRSRSNGLDTTLMVGKEGVSETVIEQANAQLSARELIKGRVLETAFMTAREASDAICEATGADGVQCVGSKFVIYRYNPELHKAPVVKKTVSKALVNPVRRGAQKRRMKAKAEREKRSEYFHEEAVKAAIARRKSQNQE